MTLNQPASPTKNRKPSFSGNASENSKVAVTGLRRDRGRDRHDDSGLALGPWCPRNCRRVITRYTAVAKEESLLGNGEGESATGRSRSTRWRPRVAEPAARRRRRTGRHLQRFRERKLEGRRPHLRRDNRSREREHDGERRLMVDRRALAAAGSRRSHLHGGGEGGKPAREPRRRKLNRHVHGRHDIPRRHAGPAHVAVEEPHALLQRDGKCLHRSRHPHLRRREGRRHRSLQSDSGRDRRSLDVRRRERSARSRRTHVHSGGNPGEPPGQPRRQECTRDLHGRYQPADSDAHPAHLPVENRKPTFSGKASEGSKWSSMSFEGPTEVGSASTTASGGLWSTGALSPELPPGDHTYTAVAKEESLLGNPEGESTVVRFTVDTDPPPVTLNQPETPSSNRTPSFTGTAGAKTEVVVRIYEGTKAEGPEVSHATASGTEGAWTSSTRPLPGLWGTHVHGRRDTEEPTREPRRSQRPRDVHGGHALPGCHAEPARHAIERPNPLVQRRSECLHARRDPHLRRLHRSLESNGDRTRRGMGLRCGEPARDRRTHLHGRRDGKSPLGNPEGKSNTVTFVNTLPPL